jgi:hypothetical protein
MTARKIAASMTATMTARRWIFLGSDPKGQVTFNPNALFWLQSQIALPYLFGAW